MEDQPGPNQERFAYWSGYAPGKLSPDGSLIPLGPDELSVEAMRFRRGAYRERQLGNFANATRLDAAADDFQRRADDLTKE